MVRLGREKGSHHALPGVSLGFLSIRVTILLTMASRESGHKAYHYARVGSIVSQACTSSLCKTYGAITLTQSCPDVAAGDCGTKQKANRRVAGPSQRFMSTDTFSIQPSNDQCAFSVLQAQVFTSRYGSVMKGN
jgi:hypothetical protein